MKYQDTPLITLETLKENPSLLIEYNPSGFRMAVFADEQDLKDGELPPIVAVFGRKHKKTHTMTAIQFALLKEAVRLGHSVVTNSNFGKPRPLIYSKFAPRDAPHDNTPLGRLFAGAAEHEAVKTLEIASDLRPENLVKFGAGKPTKSAIGLITNHVERLADERVAEGTFPTQFSKAEYLANYHALLLAMIREAGEHFGQSEE